jgi:uncharacterized protein (TIGR00369 family)
VVREAFDAQLAMATIGAILEKVGPGYVEIHLPCENKVMSHYPGIVHGGTVGMIADSALGFAALTLAKPGKIGVTAEYKINMLSPAQGQILAAKGFVIKPGSRITVAQAEIYALDDGAEKLVATAMGTLAAL